MKFKKVNGKLYKVETETISDKYKARFFIEFLQEFSLEDKFNRCKTEDERYDIYALYTRVGLSKVHPPEHFKKQETDIDSGVFSAKPNNKDNATFIRRKPKVAPKKQNEQTVQDSNEEEVCFKKIVIEREQMLSSFDIAMIRKTINDMPAQVKRIFFNNKYKIRVEQNVSYGKAAGLCNYNKRLILLDCHDGRGLLNKADDTISHELGHMIDYNYTTHTFASNGAKFKEIYNKEKLTIDVDYNYDYITKDPQEYFAQSFSEYIRQPYRLKSSAPKTYEFMKQYIEKL